ncbi:unnamed protein product [Cuscuta europaea]|uniref:F-box domain-containing protein n=1 Tax=Cuscuta europaea TaxID=41803 RepID=A0A9P0ZM04_CUSEU|nr:unnamed protein product [Cuscuta europaea]
MPYFTEDLITEILSRLPAKPLIRFKCVSKRWNSLISDPAFANLQLRRANRDDGNRLFLTTAPPQSLDYNHGAFRKLSYPAAMMKGGPPSDFIPTWVLGSCNGLIGFRGSSLRYGYAGEFLWNPTTGDYKELPDAPHLKCLIYWPTLSGVGYNVSSNDYGVLHGFTKNQSKGTRETALQLCTLKTGKWRQIQDANPDLVPHLKGRSISWNGDMFWLGCKPNGVRCLGSFDLKEEKFKEIQLPLLGDRSSGVMSLGISGNSLCVFCKGKESCFEGWALKLDAIGASCWNRLFSFPLDTLWGPRDTLLCLTKEGEILMDSGEILMDSNELRIYIYNLKDREIKYLKVDNYIDKFSKPVFYIESLVSPNN